MRNFSNLFKDDAVWGEKEVIKFRWVLVSVIIILIGYVYISGDGDRAFISLALAVFYVFYNSVLNLLLKRYGNATWIRFLSATIDISILSAHIFNYSYFFSPIAVATASSAFVFPILIMLSVLRYDGRLVVFTTLYTIFCYNLIYFLRQPYIDQELLKQVASADAAGVFYKSAYFALMGYFLFSIPKMIDRLVKKHGDAIEERKDFELKLALEKQKKEYAIQRLEVEQEMNEKLNKQKETIEEQNLKLQELVTTKDKLFSIIGHDLRTPFSIQCSLSEILLGDLHNLPKDYLYESIETINLAANNGLELLSNLLDWAKAQNKMIIHRPVKFNIRKTIEDTVSFLSDNWKHKKISVGVDLVDSSVVCADEQMIKTVVRNIVSNAIKFTPNGGSVELVSEVKDEMLQLTVKDNGVGIKQETLENIFSLQNAISTPGTNNEPGTGLGLILCKDLMEKNMGSLSVESQEGKGSSFFLMLPREDLRSN